MRPVRLPDKPLNCLHLGDSYTIGEGVRLEEGWPFHLHELMEASGYQIALAEIIARTAWTTTDLMEAIQAMDPQPEWDFITLCIGVNNQYKGLAKDDFRRELKQLIGMALALRAAPDSPLLILSIPDWSVSPSAADRDRQAVAADVDAFNAVIETVADSMSLPFLNWTPLSRQFSGSQNGFTTDGLHPEARQYRKWAAFIMDHIAGR